MGNLPSVYLCSTQTSSNNVEEIEGYVCEHSVDEEHNIVYYYSHINNQGQEILLTNEYLLQHTGINYQEIHDQLVGISVYQQQSYIEQNIEQALIKYRAEWELNILLTSFRELNAQKDPNNLRFGTKVLLTVNPQYHKKEEVQHTLKYINQSRPKKQLKPMEEVLHFLLFLEDIKNFPTNRQQLYSGLVIESENIPHSYWANQSRISEEQGQGKIDINDEYKQKQSEILIKDQQVSLDSWIDYLQKEYPIWYQTYILDGLKTMGSYNKEKNRFTKRRKDYVGVFPELNREVLSKVYDYLYKYHQGELDLEELDKELLNLLKTGSFVRLYEYFLANTKSIVEWDKQEIEGEWIRFEQTDDETIGEQLSQSLEGYNTGWCTAGVGTAQDQLSDGDFYVYYSKNKLGFATAPRAAIRMKGNNVAEVRGIEPSQNLESIMTTVIKKKIKQLPGGEAYFVKTGHMEQLTSICNKQKNGEELNVEELKFLYELDEEIQGFGYQRDPRIEELQKTRNIKQDLCKVTGLKKEEICIGNRDVYTHEELVGLKLVYGKLSFKGSDIFVLPDNFVAKEIFVDNMAQVNFSAGLKLNTLDINNTKYIRNLPEDIQVKHVFADKSNIQTLPDNFAAETIHLENSRIQELPKGLKVNYLYLNQTQIEDIPEDIQVKSGLCLNNTKIEYLPCGLDLINLDIVGTCIKQLPQDIRVRHIYAKYSHLEELPENLEVESLIIANSKIRSLPRNLKITRYLNIDEKITEFPEKLKVEVLDISVSNITEVSKQLQFNQLLAYDSSLRVIPDDILFLKELDLRGTCVEELPEGLEVETLFIDKIKKDNFINNKIKQLRY